MRLVCVVRLAILCSGLILSGCLPSGHSQLDEEKESHFLAGKSRVSSMDFKGAIESFSKAVEVNPRSGAAHLELGWLYDQKESDPAAAIYHYNKYLRLRPNADNADTIRTRVLACKQELARTVSLGPVTQSLQKEFEQLALNNKRLQEEVEKWKTYAITLQAITNSMASMPEHFAGSSTSTPGSSQQLTSTQARSASGTTPGRVHTVRAGETATQIARRYGVRLDALLSANPRLDPRRMQVGDTLKVP